MIAQIGETCTQELPLINYSNKDWTLKVQLISEKGNKNTYNCFQAPIKDF